MAEISTRSRADVALDGSTTALDGRLSDTDFLVNLNFSRRYRFDTYLDYPAGPRLAKSTDKAASDLRVPLALHQIGALHEAQGREAIAAVFEHWPISDDQRRRLTDDVLLETRGAVGTTHLPDGHNVIHLSFRATLGREFYCAPPSTCTDGIL